MESLVIFTEFPARILTSLPASRLGHSCSSIELQQYAIEWVSLWSTFNHNTQESAINDLILIPKNYIFDQPSNTSITRMTFIPELDLLILFIFCLYTSNSFTSNIFPTHRRSTQL